MDNGSEDKSLVRDSKFLARVLRHDPGMIDIELDQAGWVGVDVLLAAAGSHGRRLSRARLDSIVAHNDKKRFEFDASGERIRASQGHSVEVELGYAPATPPDVLYHGTATRSLAAIYREGLLPGKRHQVHLSADQATATKVGARHGVPAVLAVAAARMAADGHAFYQSTNGVWLTDRVPAEFLSAAGPEEAPGK
jgi:putative RNA 2'-phosphotransferase